jgi:hypothetical protein
MYPKLLRHLVNCDKAIASHKRDVDDLLRGLYSNEITGVDSKEVLNNSIYMITCIHEELDKVKSIVLRYQKSGEDNE